MDVPKITLAQCGQCGQFKPIDDFSFRDAARTRLQSICKPCKAIYNRSWYLRNKDKQLGDVRRNRARYVQHARQAVDALRTGPCTDCGGTFPPCVMDFDHVRGMKAADISRLVRTGASVDRILAEIAKCDLVCSNCHRIRTWQRGYARAGGAAPVSGRPRTRLTASGALEAAAHADTLTRRPERESNARPFA